MIYFIQATQSGLIKIGYTGGDVLHRLAELQVGSPEQLKLVCMMPGSRWDESRLHCNFGRFRARGEWFYPVLMLIRFVDDNDRDGFSAFMDRRIRLPGFVSDYEVAR